MKDHLYQSKYTIESYKKEFFKKFNIELEITKFFYASYNKKAIFVEFVNPLDNKTYARERNSLIYTETIDELNRYFKLLTQNKVSVNRPYVKKEVYKIVEEAKPSSTKNKKQENVVKINSNTNKHNKSKDDIEDIMKKYKELYKKIESLFVTAREVKDSLNIEFEFNFANEEYAELFRKIQAEY